MARSARAAATASTPSTPITPVVTPAAAGASNPGPATAAAGPSRRSTRRSLAATATSTSSASASTSTAASSSASPASSGPLTPAEQQLQQSNPHSTRHAVPKSYVEPKAHGLRNSSSARERTPCPFPADHGGSVICGVAEDDEADEVLMAICSACAAMVSSPNASFFSQTTFFLFLSMASAS